MMPEYVEWIIVAVAVVTAPLMGIVILQLVATTSGWKKLYQQLNAHSSAQLKGSTNQKARFVTGRVNNTQYKNILTVSTSRYALIIAVFPLFGFGHKPLVIPWDKIEGLKTHKLFLQDYVHVKLKAPLDTSFDLPASIFTHNAVVPARLQESLV